MTTEPIGDLNVVSIYQDLMKASTGQGSAYIHAKETLTALLDATDLTATERAAAISTTISGIATSITSQALTAAIQVAKENRDAPYTLAKLRADTDLTQSQKAQVDKDVEMTTANIAKLTADKTTSIIQGWKLQADIYSKNGIDVSGQPTTSTVLNLAGLPKNSMASDYVGGEQGKATVYSTLANAARKDGNVTITKDGSGNVTGLTPTTPLNECLTGAQINVAIRQEKAFDDNKVQHAANSSATMIGMLLSTENSSALDPSDVVLWRSAVTELNTPDSAYIVTKSITITSVTTSVSKAGFTVSGTSTGISYGSNIAAYIRSTADDTTSVIDIGIINEDSTWSMTFPSESLAALTLGAAAEIVVGLGSVYASTKAVAVTTVTA